MKFLKFIAFVLLMFSCDEEESKSLKEAVNEEKQKVEEIPTPPTRIQIVENNYNGSVYIFSVDSHEIVAVANAGLIHLPVSCKICVRNASVKKTAKR